MSDESKLIVSVISVFLVFFSVLSIISAVEEYNRQEAIVEQARILAGVLEEAAKTSPEAAATARDQIGELINQLEKEK